jgi:SHS2 domain-containing protein
VAGGVPLMGNFTEIEHTADYALRVWGIDYVDLFQTAGEGLIYLLLGGEQAAPAEFAEYEVEAPDLAALLQRALREMLYQAEQGRAPVTFEVLEIIQEPPQAHCRVGLLPPGEGLRLLRRTLKAVTYHDLNIRQEDGRLTVTLTFDT